VVLLLPSGDYAAEHPLSVSLQNIDRTARASGA
jgi:hypothetical protein